MKKNKKTCLMFSARNEQNKKHFRKMSGEIISWPCNTLDKVFFHYFFIILFPNEGKRDKISRVKYEWRKTVNKIHVGFHFNTFPQLRNFFKGKNLLC